MRVAIVGGGITGLSLAHELSKVGVEAEIFERGDELGGLAAGFEVLPGIRLERFYHHIFHTDRDFIDVATELGIVDNIMWRPAKTAFFMDDEIHSFHTPLDVLRFDPLRMRERLALAWTMAELQFRSRPGDLEDITVEEFFRRRFASGVYEKVWAPMLEAKWGEHRHELAAAWLWQKVRARGPSRRGLREELGYPVGGFSQLPEALSESIGRRGGRVHLQTTVRRIVVEGGRAIGLETDQGSDRFDAIVSTLPLPIMLQLVSDLPAPVADRCREIEYRGVVCHILVMDRPLSDIYWLNVADRTIPLGGIVEQTNFVPPEHYRGKHIAYLFNYLSQDAPEFDMSPEDFVEHHFPHVSRIVPGFDPDAVEDRFVFRARTATPVYRHPYEPPPLEPVDGLYLLDTSRIFPMDRGTSECIRLARYAAARLTGRPATPPRPV